MAEDIKGDLYYIDPAGNRWKLQRKPAERHPKDWYWHADLMHQHDNKAHRVSVSMHRLLTGIDAHAWESGHDGDTQENRSRDAQNATSAHREESGSRDASQTRSGEESHTTPERYSAESARQANLY